MEFQSESCSWLINQWEFDLEFFLSDAVSFISMNFCGVNGTVELPNRGEPFELSPTAASVLLLEPRQVAYPRTDGDGLYVSDISKDLKIHTSVGSNFD